MGKELVARLLKEEDAGVAVEYGLITAVVAVGLIAFLAAFRDKIGAWFNSIGDNVRSTST